MKNEEVIVLGDMVDLAGHKSRMYRTKIEDLTANGLFLAGVPRFGGAPMPLHANEDIYLVYYRESGRFIVRMNVVGFEKRGDIRFVWLYQKTQPYKDQRREVFRVPVSRVIRVCEHPGQDETALQEVETPQEDVSSRDLSVTGISFLTKKDYPVGDKRLLLIYILENKDEDPPFTVSATVVRCMALRESGKNLVAMKFFGLGKSQREFISKFVIEEQRKQLKQKRLVEGV